MVEEKHLREELGSIAENIDNNITTGATFVVGFLHPNDLRLKSLINTARRILGEQFGEILWILPVMHWDLSDVKTFNTGSFQGLAFGSPGTVHCNQYNDQNCAVHVAVEKLSKFSKKCWNPNCNSTENRGHSQTTIAHQHMQYRYTFHFHEIHPILCLS
jgi:hypothetical protein